MLSLFNQGPKAMESKKDKDYKKWFKNLKKNGVITKDYKISIDEDFNKFPGIELCLMMCVANGYMKRVTH